MLARLDFDASCMGPETTGLAEASCERARCKAEKRACMGASVEVDAGARGAGPDTTGVELELTDVFRSRNSRFICYET